jgi:hypothetical protein
MCIDLLMGTGGSSSPPGESTGAGSKVPRSSRRRRRQRPAENARPPLPVPGNVTDTHHHGDRRWRRSDGRFTARLLTLGSLGRRS